MTSPKHVTGEEPVTCSVCGAREPARPLTWTIQAGRGRSAATELVCDRCTRDNVRSMEAQLDREHW